MNEIVFSPSAKRRLIPNAGTVAAPSLNYSPTALDLANGFVDLSLLATSVNGCESMVSCQVTINNVLYDFGDAPISYDQNMNIQPLAAASTILSGVNLGTVGPSVENVANNSVTADGDGFEEDALTNPVTVIWPTVGQIFDLSTQATNNSNELAYMNAYVDWNADGDFLDSLEEATSILPIPGLSGTNQFPMQFEVPTSLDLSATQFYVRLRLSTDSIAASKPYHGAPQGETEDFIWPPTAPLPIELLSFTAHPLNDHGVELNWVTASEIDNDYFLLERSRDGQEFELLAQILGAGNSSSMLSYAHIDPRPLPELSYYRLKQVDHNGQHEYFGPIAYLNSITSGIVVTQIGSESIVLLGVDAESVEVVIHDLAGRRQEVRLISENFIDVSDLSKGVYLLSVIQGNEVLFNKKILLH